ncbi:MAG: DNA adenine methylase [Methylococcales bacterium]|nr:DNA adenine methylase [Methylococcales bacterium]
MAKNKLVAPFLKWVGGKRQLMPEIIKLIPKKISTYHEPFVGGGAVLFALQPKKAVINDANSELINVYYVIKNNLEELIVDLKTHKNDPDYFYKIRSLDRDSSFENLSDVQRASRIIYLNKTCFNGLYRVNNSGEFNSPFGKYTNPNIINEVTLKAVSNYLNSNDIKIMNGDYYESLNFLEKSSFVYFDPPYHPVSQSSNFTGYTQGGFDSNEQIKLRDVCNELNSKGINFLLSNSATKFIEELYVDYKVEYVKANRAINSNAEKRGEINEVLIRNYEFKK